MRCNETKEELEKLIAKIEAERREALEIMEGHPNLTYANHEFLLGKRVAFDYVLDRMALVSNLPETASERDYNAESGTSDYVRGKVDGLQQASTIVNGFQILDETNLWLSISVELLKASERVLEESNEQTRTLA